jgi:hypothetical protein
LQIRPQQIDEGADRLRHDAHLADLDRAPVGDVASDERAAQRGAGRRGPARPAAR